MFTKLREFAADESGATAIEYGLIAALVSLAGATALTALGDSIGESFMNASTEMNDAIK